MRRWGDVIEIQRCTREGRGRDGAIITQRYTRKIHRIAINYKKLPLCAKHWQFKIHLQTQPYLYVNIISNITLEDQNTVKK
jgi:hypothetical protein